MRRLKWLYPGLKVKRWLLLMMIGLGLLFLGILLATQMAVLFGFLSWGKNLAQGWLGRPAGRLIGIGFLVLGLCLTILGFKNMLRSILYVALPENPERLVEILYNRRSLKKGPKVVALGGGTGLPVLLRGLKQYTSNITAIVSVADDGGSSGRLRGELGILPPGDLRNCLIALADREQIMEELLGYRFQQGTTLAGHNLGNLLLAGLGEMRGDFHLAIQELSRVLAIRGQVIPATLTPPILGAELADGEILWGQSKIANCPKPINRVFLEPGDCRALPEALQAIKEADLVVLGPGSLFTSVIPNLLIKEINQAILATVAPVVYVCNVATQPGETSGFVASDHIKALQKHGGKELVDMVVVNTAVPKGLRRRAPSPQELVAVDLPQLYQLGVEVIGDDLIDHKSGIQHHANHLGRLIIRLIFWQKNHKERLRMLDLYFQERFRNLRRF